LLTLLIACKGNVNQQDLFGKWNYISYEYQNKSLNKPYANIALQTPFIVFNKDGSAAIYSSGKVLSKGSYQLDGKIIKYTEVLPDGQKRKIPFLIKELNDKQLIFQTMDAEVKIITAAKERN
jgi:hypothetical protein